LLKVTVNIALAPLAVGGTVCDNAVFVASFCIAKLVASTVSPPPHTDSLIVMVTTALPGLKPALENAGPDPVPGAVPAAVTVMVNVRLPVTGGVAPSIAV
jgi:hypothetical protein